MLKSEITTRPVVSLLLSNSRDFQLSIFTITYLILIMRIQRAIDLNHKAVTSTVVLCTGDRRSKPGGASF